MAPSPRVFIENQGSLQVEEVDAPDEGLEDLDAESAPYRYYESPHILGHLYRAIDEQQFLLVMQQEHEALLLAALSTSSLPEKLLQYMLDQTPLLHYEQHSTDAKAIRHEYVTPPMSYTRFDVDSMYSYEASLLDLLYQHGPSSYQPATEYEALAGCILGRRGGAQCNPLKELGRSMRQQFETTCGK